MSIIYFGIWSEQHIRNKINNWINIVGEPNIFSERDDHIEKYPHKLLGKYDVVSIDEALKRYSDADVWVTFESPARIPNWLATKMPPEKIHFLEADLEYRKGCTLLGNYMMYRETTCLPCSVDHAPTIHVKGTILEKIKTWEKFTSKLIDANRHNSPNRCQRCHLYKYGFYRNTVNLTRFNFGQSFKNDVCNFKCTYCSVSSLLQNLRKIEEGITTYEVLLQLSKVPELDTEKLEVRFSNGEFLVNKYCNEMLDIIAKSKWKFALVSNLSIYREKLAQLIEDGRCNNINVSIDSGTRETFRKIKQRDMFNRVVENLKKYPLNKTKVYLKYIFLEDINDNEDDINGYYNIAKELGAIIMLSSDDRKIYNKKMRDLILQITKRAKADGLNVVSDANHVHPKDAKFINDSYNNA